MIQHETNIERTPRITSGYFATGLLPILMILTCLLTWGGWYGSLLVCSVRLQDADELNQSLARKCAEFNDAEGLSLSKRMYS